MLVYEKNNKLNINFENSIEEQPDIVLGKEDGKTEILVDGQPSGGGGGGASILCLNFASSESGWVSDKTFQEVLEALNGGSFVYGYVPENKLYVYLDGEGLDEQTYTEIVKVYFRSIPSIYSGYIHQTSFTMINDGSITYDESSR